MNYIRAKEAAEKWGYAQATVLKWCRAGMIEGAIQDKKHSAWKIPVNTKCPGFKYQEILKGKELSRT